MGKISLIIFACFSFLQVIGQSHLNYLKTDISTNYSDLANGFNNPPDQSRLRCYWKWINSLVTKESITRDLEQFRAKGYGGVIINDGTNTSRDVSDSPSGPIYLSKGWIELYQHAVREAQRVGLEISVNAGSGWNPGGPFITPEYALKKIVYSETEIEGGKLVQMQLPMPDTNLFYRDIFLQAIRNPAKESPTKDSAIVNWSVKSFNKSFGSSGIYPLYRLREYYNISNEVEVIKKNEIQDITKYFDGAQLSWNAPEGHWLIIRFGYTCTGVKTSTNSIGWSGLSLDHLSPEAFNIFSKNVIIPLAESAQSVGNSLKYFLTDSWEMGVTNWTNHFPQEFKKFRGYDLNIYMPVLTGRVVESQEISNRFLHDFRKTVSDCIAENHYQLFADLAHQYGLGFHPESGGPHSAPIDALRIMGISDFPQGEFWSRNNSHRISSAARFAVTQSASVAHTNSKRIVGAEGPQVIGAKWARAPKELKHDLDRAYCAGVNRLFWTSSNSSPPEFGLPGIANFAGNDLTPRITWWEQADDFVKYNNRCCFMLQQGLFVADVLYYYGDDVPNFVFLKEEYPELHFGFDWDKCSKDVILNRVSVSDGKIVLPDGMNYRVLVLTPEEAIDLDVLRKVEQLVLKGATVVAPRPKRTTGLCHYPDSDTELNEIASRMWGNIDGGSITEQKYGKGRIIWGQDINNVLNKLDVKPDFSFTSCKDSTALDYIHRTMKNQDVYFLVNRFAYQGINDFEYHDIQTLPDRFEQVKCSFRVTGKIPELWDPMTGKVIKIGTYREENGQTIIPIHLEPEASVFVVFKEEKASDHIIKIEKDGREIFPASKHEVKTHPIIDIVKHENKIVADLYEKGNYTLYWSNGKRTPLKMKQTGKEVQVASPWTVHFDPQWGGPKTATFSELKSWTQFNDPNIKYYSGKATYVNTFKLKKGDYKNKKVFLDLGMVQDLADVRLNGHFFQVEWMPPFKVNVTEYLIDGENKLEIDIINQWPNRLIGDSKLPEEKRFTRTNYLKYYAQDSDQFLRESGLIGPVKLQFVSTKDISH